MFPFILTAHFVADFVLQSHWMSTNKSRLWSVLTCHVLVYSAAMTFALLLWCGAHDIDNDSWILRFGLITFGLHILTDAVTSRITSRLASRARIAEGLGDKQRAGSLWHWFFVVIGFDQLLHALALWYTLVWLGVMP